MMCRAAFDVVIDDDGLFGFLQRRPMSYDVNLTTPFNIWHAKTWMEIVLALQIPELLDQISPNFYTI